MIEVLSETQLGELKAAHEVLLAYFAPPTCSVGESLVDKVAALLDGRLVGAARIDTSASPAIAGQHLVLAFPTIIVFIFGKEFGRLRRILSMHDVEQMLDRAVAMAGDQTEDDD